MNILEGIDEDLRTLNNEAVFKDYKKCCMEEETIIHLTLTLNPKYNRADILTQFRALIREIKHSHLFYWKSKFEFQIHPGFRKLILVPELTKTINIHLHGILIIDKPYINYFVNQMRKLCWNNEVLGRQATFNLVNDSIKDRTRVSEYAWKDLEELKKFPDSKKMGILSISRKII